MYSSWAVKLKNNYLLQPYCFLIPCPFFILPALYPWEREKRKHKRPFFHFLPFLFPLLSSSNLLSSFLLSLLSSPFFQPPVNSAHRDYLQRYQEPTSYFTLSHPFPPIIEIEEGGIFQEIWTHRFIMMCSNFSVVGLYWVTVVTMMPHSFQSINEEPDTHV